MSILYTKKLGACRIVRLEIDMTYAYIVEAVRTAGGRRGGALAGWHPADLAGEVLNRVVERTGIDPVAIEDVIMGCVGQAGEQSFQIGRNAVLASALPDTVPAVSIDRQCGSSQQRSEEHQSELQSLMRISYAVFCLKKNTKHLTQSTKSRANVQTI